MKKRFALLLPLAGLITLAGCDSGSADLETFENNSTDVPIEEPVINETIVDEPEPANLADIVPPPAPAPVIADDEQILDDADASGMTSRIPDESTNDMGPVE